MATLNFDAREVEPATAFEAIPAGRYQVVITDSDMRQTRAGNGHYLWLEFEVTQGDYAGRKLWSNLNLDNPNPEAVRIANAELSAICRAVNVLTPKDSVELHNLPLTVVVRCKKDQNDTIVNDIRGYEARENPAQSGSVPAAQNAANSVPPWSRERQ